MKKIPEHICRSWRNGDRFHFPLSSIWKHQEWQNLTDSRMRRFEQSAAALVENLSRKSS
jgi:hypothetical protein